MQPPQIAMTMRHYIQNLRKVSDQNLDERTYLRRGDPAARESLETQIQRWWVNLPPFTKRRRFQIKEIAVNCTGKIKPKPALREVAFALRALGWSESRDWSKQGRNHRLWSPPT